MRQLVRLPVQSAVSAAAPFLISLLVRPPAQGWPTVRVGLPTSISLVNIIPHRQAIGYSRSPPTAKSDLSEWTGHWELGSASEIVLCLFYSKKRRLSL